jgi:hypothetical protein
MNARRHMTEERQRSTDDRREAHAIAPEDDAHAPRSSTDALHSSMQAEEHAGAAPMDDAEVQVKLEARARSPEEHREEEAAAPHAPSAPKREPSTANKLDSNECGERMASAILRIILQSRNVAWRQQVERALGVADTSEAHAKNEESSLKEEERPSKRKRRERKCKPEHAHHDALSAGSRSYDQDAHGTSTLVKEEMADVSPSASQQLLADFDAHLTLDESMNDNVDYSVTDAVFGDATYNEPPAAAAYTDAPPRVLPRRSAAEHFLAQ